MIQNCFTKEVFSWAFSLVQKVEFRNKYCLMSYTLLLYLDGVHDADMYRSIDTDTRVAVKVKDHKLNLTEHTSFIFNNLITF